MTEPPQQEHGPSALRGPDPTRDIRLPPLPDRPPPALPPGWAGVPARPSPTPPGPDVSAPPPGTSVPHAEPTAARPGGTPLADEPTDQLAQPRGRPRERTIAFASPEMAGGRPAPVIGPTPRRRRWPWVLLTLMPVLVIVGAAITLLVLLRGA